jgi:hypothetical protein
MFCVAYSLSLVRNNGYPSLTLYGEKITDELVNKAKRNGSIDIYNFLRKFKNIEVILNLNIKVTLRRKEILHVLLKLIQN